MNERDRLGLAIGIGVLGGIGMAVMIARGTRGGVSDDERKGIIAMAIIGLGGYAAAQLWDIEKTWWFSTEEAAKKAADAAQEEAEKRWGKLW